MFLHRLLAFSSLPELAYVPSVDDWYTQIQFWKTAEGKQTMKEHSIIYREPPGAAERHLPYEITL